MTPVARLANHHSSGPLTGRVAGWLVCGCIALTAAAAHAAEEQPADKPASPSTSAGVIADDFTQPLDKAWRWIREDRENWRTSSKGLQVLIEPGNMWGGANDAKNVLVREIPVAWRDAVEIVAHVSHRPEKRWEQANLVWYYSDSTMVKLGLEVEHGKTNIVMGREEGDKTRTVKIVPYPHTAVVLRLRVVGGQIDGAFRRPDGEPQDWTEVGACKLPESPRAPTPCASLQFYQGEAGSDRWATVSAFRMAKLKQAGD